MKKILIIGLCLIMPLGVISCGSKNNTESVSSTEVSLEKNIKEISSAINTRWNEQEAGDQAGYTDAQYTEILKKELNKLENIYNNLPDGDLKNDLSSYIEGCKLQIKSGETTSEDLIWQYIEESDLLRKPSLINLVDKHGVKINEENKQIYEDFKAEATVINKENDANDFVKKLGESIKLEKSMQYDSFNYQSIIENTSDFDFDHIYYDVQLLDKDDIVVGNETLSIQNFNKGSKQKIEFSTSTEHETIKILVDMFGIKDQ